MRNKRNIFLTAVYRIIIGIFAVLVGFFIIELLLQVSARFTKTVNYEGFNIKSNEKIILCVGDSYTYGIGAAKGKSYPDFLRSYLNEKIEGFKVINHGKPGINTAELSYEIQDMIDKFHPDVLLIMVGANDWWNRAGLLSSSPIDFLKNHSRVFKLFRIYWFNVRKQNKDFIMPEYSAEKLRSFSEICDMDKKNNFLMPLLLPKTLKKFARGHGLNEKQLEKMLTFCILLNRKTYYEFHKDFDKALLLIYYLKKLGIKENLVYEHLDNTFVEMKDFPKSIGFCLSLMQAFPEDEQQLSLRLGRLYKAVKDYKKALNYFNLVLKSDSENEAAQKGIEEAKYFINKSLTKEFKKKIPEFKLPEKSFKESFIYSANKFPITLRWHGVKTFTFENLDYALFMNLIQGNTKDRFYKFNRNRAQKICQIARKKKVFTVFLSYPMQIYSYIKAAAETEGVIFFDLRKNFSAKVNLKNRSRYFIQDGHCTALGYEIIGKAVADLILSQYDNSINEKGEN